MKTIRLLFVRLARSGGQSGACASMKSPHSTNWKVSKTKVFIDSATAVRVDTVKVVAGAFTEPKATAKALPKGIGRLFKRTRTTIEHGVRDEIASGESPTDAAAIAVRYT